MKGTVSPQKSPSRALDLSHTLLLELQRIKGTVSVRCAALGAEVPIHRTTDVNLDCAFVENALFTLILDSEKSKE